MKASRRTFLRTSLVGSVAGGFLPIFRAWAESIAPIRGAAVADYSRARRGFSVLILHRGKTLLESYTPGHPAHEPHKIYSGTKGFWILAALRAAEEGVFSLQEPVSSTITEWQSDPGKAAITVRELLNFTSGLDAENRLHGDGLRDRDALALRVPQVAPAGAAFIYGPAALQVFHEFFKRRLARRGISPTHFLEEKILNPLGLGPQRYLPDACGNPLLAAGFLLTARAWARVGALILRGGAPILSPQILAQAFRGSEANPGFGFGFWNNRLAASSDARTVDVEDMLQLKWNAQEWRNVCLAKSAPSDLVASIGSGYQRLFVIPSAELVIVRQGMNARFSDGEFLRLALEAAR